MKQFINIIIRRPPAARAKGRHLGAPRRRRRGNLFKIGATQLEQKDCAIQLMLMIRAAGSAPKLAPDHSKGPQAGGNLFGAAV